MRPSSVGERSRIGDWEVDTIVGPLNRRVILTTQDKKPVFLFLRKLEHEKNADGKAMIEALLSYKSDIQMIIS